MVVVKRMRYNRKGVAKIKMYYQKFPICRIILYQMYQTLCFVHAKSKFDFGARGN